MRLFHNILTITALLISSTTSFAQSGLHKNSSTFKWVRTVHSQNFKPFSEGLAAFYDAGGWGYEDKEGNIVIPADFEEAGDFNNSLAIVKMNGKWGVIDKTGKRIFECIYDNIEPFSDNTALARIGNVSYYLYSDGNSRALPQELTFYSYQYGLARIKKQVKGQDKYGYIDISGQFIMDPVFDAATDFFGNTAFVTFKGKAFHINRQGRRQRLSFPINPDNQTQFIPDGSGFIEQAGKYIFVKYEYGDYFLQPVRYDMISEFHEGRALVRDEQGKLMYLNSFGTPVLTLPEECTAAGDFCEGKAWVCYNGKYGYIDKAGEIIIDTIFSYTSDFNDGIAYVSFQGRNGLIRAAQKEETYPDMRIEDVLLSDASGNAEIESGEEFNIDVLLKNYGKDTVKGIDIIMTGKSGMPTGFTYSGNTIHVDRLQPDGMTKVTFKGIAGMDISSGTVDLNFKAIADNQLLSDNMSLTFTAIGIKQCNPVLASYWFHTTDHSPILPGDNAVIELSVMNDGPDIAKDVRVNLMWPEGTMAVDTTVLIGDIFPGETKSTTRNFIIDTTALSSGQYSVVATLAEFTGKHSDIKYLLFETGKMNTNTKLIGETAFNTDDVSGSILDSSSELLAGLSLIRTPDQDKYALIIGNEDYSSFKQQTLYEPNVDFAVSDAEAFCEYAKNIIGVPESNIILLKNATYSQMKFNLSKLAKIAEINPKTLLYVYYAGHGQVDGTTKESYLIPVDVSTTSPSEGIRLEDMYATISKSGCRRAIVFLDACYSGIGRGIVIRPKQTPVSGNMVVMTASSSTQRSMPYEEKRHGMFTYFLLKELRDTNGDIPIGDLFEAVKAQVQYNSIWINNSEQTPELISGPGIEEDWKLWTL